MAAMSESANSWQAIDKELCAMADLLSTLVKASRIPDEETDAVGSWAVRTRDGRKDRAPGDILEVWAEKLVQAGHNALLHVGDLKAGAALSDFEALMSRVRATRLNINKEDTAVTTALNTIRTEAAELLSQLEDSYYSTPYRGRPVVADTAAELKELAAISLELSGSYSGVQQKK